MHWVAAADVYPFSMRSWLIGDDDMEKEEEEEEEEGAPEGRWSAWLDQYTLNEVDAGGHRL